MNVYAALDTIIQQNIKILELFEIAATENNTNHDNLKTLIDKNKELIDTNIESIDTINDKLTIYFNNCANELNANNLAKIKAALGTDKTGAVHTVTKVVQDLQTLGSNYSSLYSLAHTVKQFIESADTADDTINTWKEIENFLSSVKDTDTLTGLLNNLNTKIIKDVRKEFLVKNADGETIRVDENGTIRVQYDAESYAFENTNAESDSPIECSMGYQSSSAYGGGIFAKVKTHYYDGTREISDTSSNLVQEKALNKHITEINNNIDVIENSIPGVIENNVATDDEVSDALNSIAN